MSQVFHIPISQPTGRRGSSQPGLVFPERCISCGAPPQAESRLVIKRLVMEGRQQRQLTLEYAVPHCEKCARLTKAVFLAGCLPFVLGLLVVGSAVFFLAASFTGDLGLDRYGRPIDYVELTLSTAAGLFAGLLGGFLFEIVSRLVLAPFFGRALWQAPLLARQLLDDSDHVAGLSAKLDPAGALALTFANDAIAGEFRALNAGLLETAR